MATPEVILKIIILGDSGVGKTSLMKCLANEDFDVDTKSTIGTDFRKLKVKNSKGKEITIVLWDTAGQERFRSIQSSYYRAAHGAFLLYDVADEKSLLDLKYWMDEMSTYGLGPGTPCVIVGSKADQCSADAPPAAKGKDFAEVRGLKHCYVSAKTEDGVMEALTALLDIILDINPDLFAQPSVNSSNAGPRAYLKLPALPAGQGLWKQTGDYVYSWC